MTAIRISVLISIALVDQRKHSTISMKTILLTLTEVLDPFKDTSSVSFIRRGDESTNIDLMYENKIDKNLLSAFPLGI